MKVLGCTGGIGSGKTYICRIFEKTGIPVYYSDDRTKELYYEDTQLLDGLISLLGSDIVINGKLQKKIVAQKIFSVPSLLKEVENIVHPAVIRDFYRWTDSMKTGHITQPPFVIIESAILLEKPLVRRVADKVLTVSAPLEVRIERIMRRDNVTREEACRRMDVQWDDKKRESISDFIIFAAPDDALLPQVEKIISCMTTIE